MVMDPVELEAYEKDYKRKGFHKEDVPLSRIIWSFTEPVVYRDLTKIDESQQPELLKNEFGEYTIQNGRHRIYLASKRIGGDPRKAMIAAWVINVHAGRHAEGHYVWQVGYKQPKRKKEDRWQKLKRLLEKVQPKKLRRYCFPYLEQEARKFLSWKTRRVLRKIEFSLQNLYSAEGNRINDWLVIAYIEDFALTHKDEEETKKKQLKKLRRYEDFLQALVGANIQQETSTASLLEELIILLQKDLQKKLPDSIRTQLNRLRIDLAGKKVKDIGMLEVLRHQLDIIKLGKVPPPEELPKLRKIIEIEKEFYKSSVFKWS